MRGRVRFIRRDGRARPALFAGLALPAAPREGGALVVAFLSQSWCCSRLDSSRVDRFHGRVAVETAISLEIHGQLQSRPDGAISELAARQHGGVAREQLVALGLGIGAIEHRISRGLLHPVHRGVYAVGHRLRTREATWMAAVLAAGTGAVLSHRSAAALWGMRDAAPAIHDVIPPRQCRRPGIRARHIVLPPDEITT